MTRKAKKDYEKNIALDVKTNPKKFWSYVKQKTMIKATIPELSTPNGTAKVDREKTEALNTFFGYVFIDEPINDQLLTLPDTQIDSEIRDILFHDPDVSSILIG